MEAKFHISINQKGDHRHGLFFYMSVSSGVLFDRLGKKKFSLDEAK